MEQLIELLGKGDNTWLILILAALFLFKDKLPFLNKPTTPATPPAPPVVLPTDPATPVNPATPERPIIDAIIKQLPVILPVILPLILKAAKESDKEPPK